jgi:hypothetical protein
MPRAGSGFQRITRGVVPPIDETERGGANGRFENRRGATDSPRGRLMRGEMRKGALNVSGEERSAQVRCYFSSQMIQHLKGIFFFVKPLCSSGHL